jgi:hypothetical protein
LHQNHAAHHEVPGQIRACLNPAISTANPPVLIVTGGA